MNISKYVISNSYRCGANAIKIIDVPKYLILIKLKIIPSLHAFAIAFIFHRVNDIVLSILLDIKAKLIILEPTV